MIFIQWKSSYCINIDIIDIQHKHLVDLINELAEAKQKQKDSEIHSKVLKELVDYTMLHFKDEEEYMQKIGYPHILEHKAQHKILIRQIVDILQKYKNGQTQITDRLLDILNNWLIKHILKQDKDIGTFVNSRM